MTSGVGLLDLEVMGGDLGARHRGRPNDRGRPLLDLAAGADYAAGPATDQVARLEMLMDGRQDPLAVAQVRGAGEQQAQIAGPSSLRAASSDASENASTASKPVGAAHGDADGHA